MLLTINRKGRCKTTHQSHNQCRAVGHEEYEYKARVTVELDSPNGLDHDGFITDHETIHKAVQDVFQHGMSSCEIMAMSCLEAIKDACTEVTVRKIYVALWPVAPDVMAFMECEATYDG